MSAGTAHRLGQRALEFNTDMHVRTQAGHKWDGAPYGPNLIENVRVGKRNDEGDDRVVRQRRCLDSLDQKLHGDDPLEKPAVLGECNVVQVSMDELGRCDLIRHCK